MTATDHISLWNKCLQIIKDNVGEQVFNDWFSTSSSESYSDGIVTIRVPSHFVRQLYESRFSPIILSAMKRVYGENVDLRYTIAIIRNDSASDVKVSSERGSRVIQQLDRERAAQTVRAANPNPLPAINDTQLNPVYNFENYCVGESNRLPYTMAKFIAENPSNSDFNPFFLWGSVGVGKTHLMQSIGIRIKEMNPDARVLYVTLRMFQHQQQVASMEKKFPDFLYFYQNIDVLLIDDLQELKPSAPKTMDALFSVFQHLQMHGKKLIFTSDRAPKDLDGITDRLIDRFKWGLVEELPKPDLALRKSILRKKAAQSGLDLSDHIIDLIAENVTGSVRELEGVVMSILSRAIGLNIPITEKLVESVLRQVTNLPRQRQINFDMIVEATADYYHINPDIIFSKNKLRDIADARQIIMYLSRKFTPLSLKSIGRKLNRSHSTVLHGISTVTDHLDCEKELAQAVLAIEEDLKRSF